MLGYRATPILINGNIRPVMHMHVFQPKSAVIKLFPHNIKDYLHRLWNILHNVTNACDAS